MNKRFRKRFELTFLVLLQAFFLKAQEQGMEISGFRVPEYNEQGQMVYQLFGDHAFLESDGIVNIEGVRVEFYRENQMFMEVSSPQCFYDQKTHKVKSDASVSSQMDGVTLTGTGYTLNTEARTVHVLKDSRVVFQDGPQQSEDPSVNETVITSTELLIDYTKRSARFADVVHIQSQEASLRCDLLDVFFNENNKIKQAVATSNVTVFNQETTMTCEKLDVFFTEDNEIERALADSGVVIKNAEWRVSGKHGTLMYLEQKAFLEEDVQVNSKEMSMTCDKLNLGFDENNEINWIEAVGKVRMLSEGKRATAGKAVYDAKTDEFVLEENPKLVDGKNMLMGDRIRFWRSTGRMVCEPARAIIFPDENFKTQFFEK